MKAIKIFSLILLIFAAGIFFISCPDNDLGNNGTLVIKLPGGDNSSRAVMEGFDIGGYLSELKYSIVCEGAGPTIKSEGSAGQYIQLYLAPGKWDITLTVINRNGRVTGSQTETVNIEAGKTSSANFKFTLDEPIYFTTHDSSYTNDDDERTEQFFWATDINRKFNEFYSKPLVNNSTYHITVKGYSNVQMDNVRMDLYFYRGLNKENPWEGDWDDNWKIIGNMWNEPYQKIPKGDFGLTFNVTTNFYQLNNDDFDKLKEADRIYYHIENLVPYTEKEDDGIIKAAITHFDMTVKESLSFDMYVWNYDGKSGWSSGHDRNALIKVVPDYLDSIKSNTMYKITARGHSNAALTRVQGQFQFTGFSEATNFDVGSESKTNVLKDNDFDIILYVTTNNEINSNNQRNVIFTLISNGSESPSNEPESTKMATVTNFSMKIEEVITAPNGLIYTLNDDRESFSVRGSATTTGPVNIQDYWQETNNSPRWPVTEIAEWGFSGNKNITSVSLPNGLISIGRDAFSRTLLTSVTIPVSVVTIGRGVFFETESLKSVVIPPINSSLTSIGEMAFAGTTGITYILIPQKVGSIGRSAFYNSNLENVIILAESPPDLLFWDEDSNYNVEPNAGGHFFGNNGSSRPTFYVPENSLEDYQTDLNWGGRYYTNNFFPMDENCLVYSYWNDGTAIVKGTVLVSGDVTIPAVHNGYQITHISDKAFMDNTNITSVSIPDTVTSIGMNAFENCYKLTGILNIPSGVTGIEDWTFKWTNLTEVIIPDSVTFIGQGAFSFISTLTSVSIGNGVTEIEEYAFEYTGITSLILPENLTEINSGAFANCSNLIKVEILATTPPVLKAEGKQNNETPMYNWFDGNASDRKFYVPADSLNIYKNTDGWKEYADFIYAIE